MKFVYFPRNAPTLQGSVPRGERNVSLMIAPSQPLLCSWDLYSAPPSASLTIIRDREVHGCAWCLDREFLQVEGNFTPNLIGLKTLWSFSSFFFTLQRGGTLKPFCDIGHIKSRQGPIDFIMCSSVSGTSHKRCCHGSLSESLSPQWFFLKNKGFY